MPRSQKESADLTEARRRLALAEAAIETAEGVTHLQEGLELLESVAADRDRRQAGLARRLGATYAKKVHEHVQRELGSGRNLPEHVLQHAFALLRCFDGKGFDVPSTSRDTKIDLVRRLIDIHYEGYPEADKRRAYEELAEIVRASGKD